MSDEKPVGSEGADSERAKLSGGSSAARVDAPAAPPCPSSTVGPGPDFAEKVKAAGRRRIPAKGRGNHPADCTCTRCLSFTPGPNGTAITRLTHGAYSLVEIQGRAAEVADGIAAALREEQLWRESFRPTVDACAIVLVRLERANAALMQMDEVTENPLTAYLDRDGDPFQKLRGDARSWANVARGYLNDLGLTPRSLAAIARDTGLARSSRASAALTALAEHVEREHVA